MMNNYESSKKARRIASMAYLAIMAVIMTGTYFSEQKKEAARMEARDLQMSGETLGGFSGRPGQN